MPGKRARSALAEWDLWTDLRQVLTLINIHFVWIFFGGEGGASSRHRALVGEVTFICTAIFGS